MQWGSKTPCQSSFARRYLPKKSITQQQFRNQSLVPRCQLSVVSLVSSPEGDASFNGVSTSSPPRRARLKPPLSSLLVVLLLLSLLPTIIAADALNLTGEEAPSSPKKEPKLRIFPAARQAFPIQHEKPIEFECTGGREPYQWVYHIQNDVNMADWRFSIRHNKANCRSDATLRTISTNSSSRVYYDPSTGKLIFNQAMLNDTGIYRCNCTPTEEFTAGCIELHFLAFEEVSYLSEIRIIYTLFAVIIFVASLATAWQLWNSSAFHRKTMARSRSADGSKSPNNSPHHGFGGPLRPVMRFFSRSRSSSAQKPSLVATEPSNPHDDPARWPVLRRRLSSIDDASPLAVPVIQYPVEAVATASEEQVQITDDLETHK